MSEDYTWEEIEANLGKLKPVEGGHSNAVRGTLKLPGRDEIFIKIGDHSTSTGKWCTSEIRAYHFLEQHDYPHAGTLVAVNPNQTGFATQAYTEQTGWEWDTSWSKERLHATLTAVNDLDGLTDAAIKDTTSAFPHEDDLPSEEGWSNLTNSETARKLLARMSAHDEAHTWARLKSEGWNNHAQKAQAYSFRNDTLIHLDVRADNCAWNKHTRQVKLVDWNWAGLGDREIDRAYWMTSVIRHGFHLPDQELRQIVGPRAEAAFHWIAGFWLAGATKPETSTGLRQTQLLSGLTALTVSEKLRNQ